MNLAKRMGCGLLLLISWLVLFAAVTVTSANLLLNEVSHPGGLISATLQDFSMDPKAATSLLDDVMKNAGADTKKQIEKNRATINQTIESLAGSVEFQNAVSKPADQIAQALLAGSPSVTVDFSRVAILAAGKINAAVKTTVIPKKELAKLKPQILKIEKQSKVVGKVHRKLRAALLIWLVWILLLALLFLLKKRGEVRSMGLQLVSIGVVFLIIRFVAPIVADFAVKKSTSPLYVVDLLPKILGLTLAPVLKLSIIVLVVGVVLLVLNWFLKRSEGKKSDTAVPTIQPQTGQR